MEVSLALSVCLTLPVEDLLDLLMVLLNVIEVVLVVLTGAVIVIQQGAPVTSDAAEELHLSGESLQLTPELSVLLLELGHGSPQGSAQVGRLLQATLHAHFESADVQVDLPDGVTQRVLVPSQSCAHGLPLRGGRSGVTQVSHLSQGLSFHQYSSCRVGLSVHRPDSLKLHVCERSTALWRISGFSERADGFAWKGGGGGQGSDGQGLGGESLQGSGGGAKVWFVLSSLLQLCPEIGQLQRCLL